MVDENAIFFDVIGELSNDIIRQISIAARLYPAKHIQLNLCGPGTDADMYRLLFGHVEYHRTQNRLITQTYGDCLSGFAVLAAMGSPGLRYMHRYALLGVHEPYLTEVSEDPAAAAADRLAIEKERKLFYDLMTEFTGKTRAWWRKKLKGKSMIYLELKDAIRYGLVDKEM